MQNSNDIKNEASLVGVLDDESIVEKDYPQEEEQPSNRSPNVVFKRKDSEESDFFLFVKSEIIDTKNAVHPNANKNQFLMNSAGKESSYKGNGFENVVPKTNLNEIPNRAEDFVSKCQTHETKDNYASCESENDDESEEPKKFNTIVKKGRIVIPKEGNRKIFAPNKIKNSLDEKPYEKIHLLEKPITHTNNNQQQEISYPEEIEHTDKQNENMNIHQQIFSIVNVWNIESKPEKHNSDLILTILDIGYCKEKYHFHEGENVTKEFWARILEKEVFKAIFQDLKPETIRKYFHILDKVENINKVERYIQIILKYKSYINQPRIKLLSAIRCITSFLTEKKITFPNF